MSRPACPNCGVADDRQPDALGVHRCSTCAIEFRPERRMPIRGASVPPPTGPHPDRGGVVVAVALVAVALGLGFAVSRHEAATRGASMIVPVSPPPILDPAIDPLGGFSELELPLRHELHLSQISQGELFATGLVYADEQVSVEQVSVELSCRDLAGNLLATPKAVVSCKTLQPRQRCAWMLASEVPGDVTELEVHASARATLGLSPPQLDFRSDRPDELSFDPNQKILKFTTSDAAVLEAWATVTAYNAQQRVLGVSETHWPELAPGRHELEVTIPKPPSEVAHYEVRVGGDRPDLLLPMAADLDERPRRGSG